METLNQNQKEYSQKSGMPKKIWYNLYLFICGVLVGGGAILPGISGGVLCVVFGIYQPMMEFLAKPASSFRKHYKMFIPVGIGWVVGFWGFAKIVEILFNASELYTTWLFIGLIAGTFPALFKEAGKQGRTKTSWIGFVLAFCAMLAMQLVFASDIFPDVTPNLFWYLFSGGLWGFSLVVPGMSSSSILMSLDLYESLNAGIAQFDLAVIVPWILGLVAVVLIFTKLVTKLFELHYSLFYHCVLGIVIASMVVIIPTQYNAPVQLVWSFLAFAGGAVIAWLFSANEPQIEAS